MAWARDRNALVLAALLVFGLTVGGGHQWSLSPVPLRRASYFDLLARSFLAGRTWLALDGPLLDMSPHGGRVYLYWGPGTALPDLVARAVTLGREPAAQVVTPLCVLLGAALCASAAAMHCRDRRMALCAAGALAVNLAAGSPAAIVGVGSAGPHNQAVATSVAAVGAAVWCLAWMAKTGSARRAALVGAVLGLAVATRISNVFLVPGFLLGVFFLGRHPWRCVGAATVTLGAWAAVLMAYNTARFGSPLDTGFRYAACTNEATHRIIAQGLVVSQHWFVRNLCYYLAPPDPGAYPTVLMMPAAALLPLTLVAAPPGPARRIGLCLALAATGTFSFLLFYGWTAVRFAADFAVPALTASYMAAATARRHRRVVAGAMATCAAWSVCAHWDLVNAEARKVTSAFMWAGDGRLPERWEHHALTALVGLALWVQVRPAVLRGFRKQR